MKEVDPRPSEHFGGSDIRFGQLNHGAAILDRSLHQGYGIGFPTRDPPPDTVSGRDIAHICVAAFTMVVPTVARLQLRAKQLCALSHALGARKRCWTRRSCLGRIPLFHTARYLGHLNLRNARSTRVNATTRDVNP